MAKVLLINPNKWGRGITTIWIPSHTAILRANHHQVELFDCTFYADWTINEVNYNTKNQQYKPTDYGSYITYNNGIYNDLAKKISEFKPDIVFWSALSSHIHGEGEYVNIQYGYELISNLKNNFVTVTGGLQATANPSLCLQKFPQIDYLIRGESEFVLTEFANNFFESEGREKINGLAFQKQDGSIQVNPPQPIIKNMDDIPPYDYSVFDTQVFYRPYNGKVIKAVDYELSRGCVYSCQYCVETVIQDYYGFDETSSRGTLTNAKSYLRNKSAKRIFEEMMLLHKEYSIELFRCQDTNFLTIKLEVLKKLADLINENNPNIKLYIETRPEGINKSSIQLLKRLKVDGVGMGVELSEQTFREDKLGRFADQDKIINAFQLLANAGIKRTAYNIIGLPEQEESSILETIKFNQMLNPDNITVAFYSPYLGTAQQKKSQELNYFDDYEYHVDGQLRTQTKHSSLSPELLNFYKANFTYFVRNGFNNLKDKKIEFGIL